MTNEKGINTANTLMSIKHLLPGFRRNDLYAGDGPLFFHVRRNKVGVLKGEYCLQDDPKHEVTKIMLKKVDTLIQAMVDFVEDIDPETTTLVLYDATDCPYFEEE